VLGSFVSVNIGLNFEAVSVKKEHTSNVPEGNLYWNQDTFRIKQIVFETQCFELDFQGLSSGPQLIDVLGGGVTGSLWSRAAIYEGLVYGGPDILVSN
jgi:hypothetical protein